LSEQTEGLLAILDRQQEALIKLGVPTHPTSARQVAQPTICRVVMNLREVIANSIEVQKEMLGIIAHAQSVLEHREGGNGDPPTDDPAQGESQEVAN